MRHYRSTFARLLVTAVTAAVLLGGPTAASASETIVCITGQGGQQLYCI
jgi:hypothetical protein